MVNCTHLEKETIQELIVVAKRGIDKGIVYEMLDEMQARLEIC